MSESTPTGRSDDPDTDVTARPTSEDDDRRAGFGTSITDQDALDVAASDDITLRLSEGR
ncbi:hypothetical protein [Petropleomorpha daqingensis]|uniref:Uncharacterized protein n=1 Tax=Petropleomorpha daqingensis TaxID=2026353 RepID=A0A853CE08_9ACTN|nr:hypothetical protein [Petropleomorpha daqingensis]NYJ04373.1 hypothetical protein [Petropleomorpha daqingensis]